MGLDTDALDPNELMGVVLHHRNLALAVNDTMREVRTKIPYLDGCHLRFRLGCHCHDLGDNCAP
jgi:hypothetical protein